jgi:cell division protein ZapA
MSNVTLQIGGRAFTVACASGEEAHVGELGRMIDAMITGSMRTLSEPRMLLFAALMLADELHEARTAAQAAADAEARAGRIADRLETLAQDLEERAANP